MTSKHVNALLLGGALLLACAQGTEGPVGYGTPDGGEPVSATDAGSDAGSGGDGDGFAPGDGDGDGSPSDGNPGDGTPSDGDPGLPDAGTPGDGDGGDGSGDGDGDGAGDGDGDGDPGLPVCPASNDCNAATRLNDFNGDDDGQPDIITPGSGSQWFRINVLESSSSIFLTGLSVRFDLSSIADSNYDLFVYQGCDDTSPDPSTQPAGALDSVLQEWGDTPLVGDERELFVEVRHVSGQCAAWTLGAIKP